MKPIVATQSASDRRKPARSASAIVADKDHGRHELQIDASTLYAAAPVGAGGFLSSSPFTVGGHRWRIRYYPNGDRVESKGYVSVFLFLDQDVAEPVTARCLLTLVAETRALFFIHRKEVLVSRPELQHDFASRTSWGYPKFDGRQSLATRVRRGGDRFTIRCDVVVVNGFRTEEATPSATIPPSDLHKHLGDLLLSGRGADVVFEVGGETFAAHRCVLAARSSVLSAGLLGSASASDGAVGAGAIRVDGVDPPAFGALLRYAYTDSLQEMDRDEEDAVLRNLLVAADRYCIQRLKLICEDKLCRLIDVGTVQTTLELAERHHCDRLKEACLRFLGAPGNLRAAMGTRGQ